GISKGFAINGLRCHVDDPVGAEPGNHVVVTGDGDKSLRDFSAADGARDRGRANAGHRAVDDAGEFVEDNERSALCWGLSLERRRLMPKRGRLSAVRRLYSLRYCLSQILFLSAQHLALSTHFQRGRHAFPLPCTRGRG